MATEEYLHFVDRNNAAAQALHGGGEGGGCPSGRLVEQVSQDFAFEQVECANPVDHLAHFVGNAEDVIQVCAVELLDREDIFTIEGCVVLVAQGQVRIVIVTDGRICWAFFFSFIK